MENKKKSEKKIKKDIKKEIKNETKKKIPKKKIVTRKVSKKEEVITNFNEPFLEDRKAIKEKQNKKTIQKLELIVIVFFSIIMLILLCNRTFFRRNYKTSKINIDIPLLMFFKKDDGNKLVLRTLRKSDYVKDFFKDKLNNDYKKYDCNGHKFYYDENNHFAIYSVKVEKDFIVKTVTITYANGSAECLCSTNLIGKKAEEYCK